MHAVGMAGKEPGAWTPDTWDLRPTSLCHQLVRRKGAWVVPTPRPQAGRGPLQAQALIGGKTEHCLQMGAFLSLRIPLTVSPAILLQREEAVHMRGLLAPGGAVPRYLAVIVTITKNGGR